MQDRVTALVRAELARTGMTQTAFAAALGHGKSWIAQKLSGARRWTLDDLELIRTRMPGVRLEQLFPDRDRRRKVEDHATTTYDVPLPLERTA